MPDTDADYAGEILILAGDTQLPAQARLAGQVEPVDGRFHWGGRLAPGRELAELVRAGRRGVRVRIGDGPAREATLGEVDPWGGVRLRGTGPPPWAAQQAD
ncbi:MAG: DUF4873 domain-containing protein [Micromonosporaceae bacterium]|nr:DUF4873 domain-containing protein [Micromonosporaceae bacterium]